MTAWTILIYGVVLAWLMPGAIWRPVALALLITWAAGEGWSYWIGDQVPKTLYRVGDCIVLLTIAAKRGHWSELLIIPLICAQWHFYDQPGGFEQWAWLTWLALAQFAIAGPWPQIGRALSFYSHGPMRAGHEAA